MPNFPLVDCDQHYYEPYDCFTRHLESKFQDRAVHPVVGKDGLGRVYQGERRLSYVPTWYIDYVAAPGSLFEYYSGEEQNRTKMILEGFNGRDFPVYIEKAARLAMMDEQNIQASFMIPTLGVAVEHDLHRDPEALYANFRAFNRWVEEDWGFGQDGRIFGVPVLSLVDPAEAARDVEWMINAGAKLLTIRLGPIFGKSPADPSFDAVWSRINEARIPVVVHVGDAGATYAEMSSVQFGERAAPPMHQFSAFQYATCTFERPVVDTTMSLILHNLFGRFPNVRIASVENGSDWVEHTLHSMDKAHRQTYGRESTVGGDRTRTYGVLQDKPSDIFREHFWVNPFVEEEVQPLIDLLGADHVIWGSDYPHPEGVASAADHAASVEKTLSEQDAVKVLRENTLSLLR